MVVPAPSGPWVSRYLEEGLRLVLIPPNVLPLVALDSVLSRLLGMLLSAMQCQISVLLPKKLTHVPVNLPVIAARQWVSWR